MTAYLSRQEFFTFGLPSKAFVSTPLVVASADATADVLEVPSHGFSEGDRARVVVNAGGGGLPAGVLPAGLSPSILYFAKVGDLGSDMLQLSLTNGGAAVDFTDAGSAVFSIVPDFGAKLDAALEAISRHGDQSLLSHSTPLAVAPTHFKMWLAEILAYRLSVSAGLIDPQYAKDPALATRAQEAQRRLNDLGEGELLDGAVDGTPDVADDGAVAWGEPDRCWSPCGNI